MKPLTLVSMQTFHLPLVRDGLKSSLTCAIPAAFGTPTNGESSLAGVNFTRKNGDDLLSPSTCTCAGR